MAAGHKCAPLVDEYAWEVLNKRLAVSTFAINILNQFTSFSDAKQYHEKANRRRVLAASTHIQSKTQTWTTQALLAHVALFARVS